jgi:hypothetical protein
MAERDLREGSKINGVTWDASGMGEEIPSHFFTIATERVAHAPGGGYERCIPHYNIFHVINLCVLDLFGGDMVACVYYPHGMPPHREKHRLPQSSAPVIQLLRS